MGHINIQTAKSRLFRCFRCLVLKSPESNKQHLWHDSVYTSRFLSGKKCCISRVECSLLFHFLFWWDIREGRATCKRASNFCRDHSTSSRSFALFQKMQQRCTSGQQFQTSEINKDYFLCLPITGNSKVYCFFAAFVHLNF